MTVEELETWTVKQLETWLKANNLMFECRCKILETNGPEYAVYTATLHHANGWETASAFSLTAALANCMTMRGLPPMQKDSGQ